VTRRGVLSVLWVACLLSVVGLPAADLVTASGIFSGLAIPVLGVITWWRAPKRGALVARWLWPYRITCVALAVACVLGVASSARNFTLGQRDLESSLIAVLFAVIGLMAWRAIVEPSPRRAAAMCPVFYVLFGAWAIALTELKLDIAQRWFSPALPLVACFFGVALAAALSLVAFGAPLPDARVAS
jgi:hypothetical protein